MKDTNNNNSTPIFQPIFGESWSILPPVMHLHYANHPFSDDVAVAEGTMDVTFNWLARLLSPLLHLTGALVPYQGRNIPVTVHFRSFPDSSALMFDREFRFPNRKPFYFRSRITPIGGAEVIEYMRFGIGWKADYIYSSGKVKLLHRGYVWRIAGRAIPLPISWILGKGYAEEEALSNTSFRMHMHITHPIWGKLYDYRGIFEMRK